MPRVIEYEVQEHGWATGSITIGTETIPLDASYIVDTLTEMAQALILAAGGEPEVEWKYFHEPAVTYVVLRRSDTEFILTLLRSDDDSAVLGRRPKYGLRTRELETGSVRLRDLVSDVILCRSRMLAAYGEDGYLKRWRRPFPKSEIETLKAQREVS